MLLRRLLSLALVCGLVAGCGGSSSESEDPVSQVPSSGGLRERVAEAQKVTEADFEPAGGRTLQQLADELGAAPDSAALATSVFVRGTNRLAFGTVDQEAQFVYGRSAVYVAPEPGAKARGPYVAPADVLVTDPAFRSEQAAAESDPFAAVYAAQVPFERTGRHTVLTVTEAGEQTVAALGEVQVSAPAKDPIPGVGDPAPKVQTDTLETAGGVVERIDTRQPPSDMHEISFADVVGRKPVALLFATPQLCQSRVCGPVVDVALQLRERYGDRVEFIHQEVFADNDPGKGLRRPLSRFNLRTEPWLFVVGRDGRVTARLEGSFGLRAFEDALKTAL